VGSGQAPGWCGCDVLSLLRWLCRGHPPDGACCSRRAGLQQCRSFVEMCIASCLSTSAVYVCGLYLTSCGWLLFGWM
jgi:hypothetical protein